MTETTYHAPHGGHPGQTQLLTDRAMFTEAYAVIPRGTMRDIVTSRLPFWEDTRVWVLARPLSGFAETFSQYIVEVGPGGGPPGDLYVEIHVDSHPTFTRHGNDLHSTVTLPMTAAALGTTLTLPLLEADLDVEEDSEVRTDYDLEVKAGTQSGSEQILRGFGVPGLRGGRGDLIVTVIVDTPTRLDPRQEELLRELAAIRGEESPDGQNVAPNRSMFGRLRDAFQG